MSSNVDRTPDPFRTATDNGRILFAALAGREFAGDLHLRRGDESIDFEFPIVNVYVPQIEHVSECVLNRINPVISAERGSANIAVIELH